MPVHRASHNNQLCILPCDEITFDDKPHHTYRCPLRSLHAYAVAQASDTMSHARRADLDDAATDSLLKKLVAWSDSFGGPKTKPSHIQLGPSLMSDIGTARFHITCNQDQYNKLLAALTTVLTNLEAK